VYQEHVAFGKSAIFINCDVVRVILGIGIDYCTKEPVSHFFKFFVAAFSQALT